MGRKRISSQQIFAGRLELILMAQRLEASCPLPARKVVVESFTAKKAGGSQDCEKEADIMKASTLFLLVVIAMAAGAE